jgi:ribulose-5-phosphate 4-epimerase/fuculose-1-phosphate aldolase
LKTLLGKTSRYDHEATHSYREEDLTSFLAAAMEKFPDTYAILVRRHGVYIWGDNPDKAKTQAEW